MCHHAISIWAYFTWTLMSYKGGHLNNFFKVPIRKFVEYEVIRSKRQFSHTLYCNNLWIIISLVIQYEGCGRKFMSAW